MAFPTYTRLPFSAYPQNPVADSYNAGYAGYGAQINAQNAYEANQRRLSEEKAWQAQQQSADQNTYFNRVELEKELAYNENEIRALTLELQNMRSEWGDLDSMDRKLAANRAAIGDFGNARAHQNDIIARQNDRNRVADTAMQWRWQADQNRISREADQQKQAKAEIKRIIGEIEDIDAQIPYHTEPGAVKALETKRARLVRELTGYGVSHGAEKEDDRKGADSDSAIIQDIAKLTDKKGNFISTNGKSDEDNRNAIAKRYMDLGLFDKAKEVLNTKTATEVKKANDKVKAEKEEARKLVSKYQNLTEAQRADFSSRWNKNDPNDKEIKLLRKYATFNGSAPVMK